jgi:hypothetical protein
VLPDTITDAKISLNIKGVGSITINHNTAGIKGKLDFCSITRLTNFTIKKNMK